METKITKSDLLELWAKVCKAYREFEAMPNSDMVTKAEKRDEAMSLGLMHVRLWRQWSKQSPLNTGYLVEIGAITIQG